MNNYGETSAWVVTTTAEVPLVGERVDCCDPVAIRCQMAFSKREAFADAGENSNRVYVSLWVPTTTNLFNTVVAVACRNAKGLTTESDIVAGIWSDFTDLDVRRVDGRQMTYWARGQQGATDTPQLVARPDANGNCQAWSGLFRDALRVQGISAHRIKAQPVSEPDLLVPRWAFVDPPSGSGRYPDIPGQDLFDLGRIAAQGNTNSPYTSNAHWLVEYLGAYYDPSYGTTPVGGPNRDIQYEDQSCAGCINAFPVWSSARRNDTSAGSASEAGYANAD